MSATASAAIVVQPRVMCTSAMTSAKRTKTAIVDALEHALQDTGAALHIIEGMLLDHARTAKRATADKRKRVTFGPVIVHTIPSITRKAQKGQRPDAVAVTEVRGRFTATHHVPRPAKTRTEKERPKPVAPETMAHILTWLQQRTPPAIEQVQKPLVTQPPVTPQTITNILIWLKQNTPSHSTIAATDTVARRRKLAR